MKLKGDPVLLDGCELVLLEGCVPCRWRLPLEGQDSRSVGGLDLPLEGCDSVSEGCDLVLLEGWDLVPLEDRAFAAKSRPRNEYQFIPSSSNDSPINLLSVEEPS